MLVCYALVSDGRDRFAAMNYLSIQAARRLDAQLEVHVLCDQSTAINLERSNQKLLDIIDQVHVVDCPFESAKTRSAFLKVSAPAIISRDFLFLDVDTLPIRPFAEVPAGDWVVAAVQDRNHVFPIRPGFSAEIGRLCDKLGWQQPFAHYFNSGVVYYRGGHTRSALAQAWHSSWLQLFGLSREWDDQFALNHAIDHLGVRTLELPTVYNAMVAVHPVHARGAKILHFFAGTEAGIRESLLEHLLDHFQSTHEIDWDAIALATRLNHPWMPPYWPRRLWQTGNYSLALRTALLNLPKKMARQIRYRAVPVKKTVLTTKSLPTPAAAHE